MKKKFLVLGMAVVLGVSTYSTVLANDVTNTETENATSIFQFKRGFNSEEKLAQLAEVKGITVDELKEQMENMPHQKGMGGKGMRGFCNEEKLQELANEKGITVEELKQQMQADKEAFREEKLKMMAEEKGITVEELKQQIEEKRAEKEAFREQMLAEKAAELGISVEEMKEKIEQKRQMKFLD